MNIYWKSLTLGSLDDPGGPSGHQTILGVVFRAFGPPNSLGGGFCWPLGPPNSLSGWFFKPFGPPNSLMGWFPRPFGPPTNLGGGFFEPVGPPSSLRGCFSGLRPNPKPLQPVGRFAAHRWEGLLGRPRAPRPQASTISGRPPNQPRLRRHCLYGHISVASF
jgi:hypothetical protein